MTRAAFIVSVALGVGCLAFGYSTTGFEQVPRWLLFFGALWIFAEWRRWTWLSSWGFLALLALAAFGLWSELSPAWMFAGALGGLFAWDLSDFMRRLRFALEKGSPGQYDEMKRLERQHLARLALVALIGILLVTFSTFVRLTLSFEWIVFLALAAVLGTLQVIAWLRNRQ
ncbi:MAG: hypothetical protein Fur0043_27040 [Anaerolineales bacterium]